jgi:2-keto-3-deoxy-L-rhamnonate aldolase RhmA
MPLLASDALNKIRRGELALGMGVHHLRGAAVPMLAKAAGFDWLFIDSEHGVITTHDISQICLAALAAGIAPVVRVCTGAPDEGTRALDNGALGVVVPHVDTAAQAKELVRAFGYRPPAQVEAQATLNEQLLVVAMIETPLAVENADAIAAVAGIDVLLIGTNDLSNEMGLTAQPGHEKVQAAYAAVVSACRRHNKILGMGGVYDQQWASHYIGVGARFVLAASDHMLLINGGTQRTEFLRGVAQ